MTTLREQTSAAFKRVAQEFNTVRSEMANIGGASDAAEVTYGSYGYDTVGAALDSLLYKAIAINSFNNSVGNKERGQTVTAVTLSWSTNKTPTTLKLNNETIDAGLTSKTLTDLSITGNTTWTLVATDEKGASGSKSTSISFLDKRYWGVGTADAEGCDSAFILGLTGELATSRGKTFTSDAGSGQYIYYAYPASWGTPTFKVGGFEGGFTLLKTFDFTNASGATVSYVVYRSDNHSLGSTTVAVS